MKNISFLLLALLFMFTGCSKTFKSEGELLSYVMDESNGYTQKKTVNGVEFTLTYRPTDLLVNQELSGDVDLKRKDSLRKKYNQYMYFNLSMSKNNHELLNSMANDQQKFGAMVNQLAFGMNEKVHLYTQSKDTIEMIDFVYPRMYGMSRNTTMMLVYPKNRSQLNDKILNFTIEDLGLWTGEVKFKMETKKFKYEPKLSFNHLK